MGLRDPPLMQIALMPICDGRDSRTRRFFAKIRLGVVDTTTGVAAHQLLSTDQGSVPVTYKLRIMGVDESNTPHCRAPK